MIQPPPFPSFHTSVFDAVLITEDNSQISTFNSRLGRRLGSIYLQWYASKVNALCQRLSKGGKSVLIVANRELTTHLIIQESVTVLFLDELMERTDIQAAGQLAAQMSDLWLRKLAVHLNQETSESNNTQIPLQEIAFVQTSFLFCFYATFFMQMWELFLSRVMFKEAWMMGNCSDIENIACQSFQRAGKNVQVRYEGNVILKLRALAFELLYLRDRRKRLNRLNVTSNNATTRYQTKKNHDVLLVACHALQLKTAIPLAKLLLQHSISCHLVVPKLGQATEEWLNREQVSWSFATDYLTASHFALWRRSYGVKLKDAWNKIIKHLTPENFLKTNEVDLFDANMSKLRTFTHFSLAEACLWKEISEQVITSHRPKAVTVFSDARFLETTIAAVANAKKIKSLLLSPNPVMSADAINRYNTCQYLGLVGDHIFKRLAQRGDVDPLRMRVVGDLRFDELPQLKSQFVSASFNKQIGVSSSQMIVSVASFYTTSWHPVDEKTAFFQSIARDLRAIGNVALVVKAHPNEDENLLRLLLKKEGIADAVVVKNVSLYHLLLSSRFLITLASSMTPLEAMMLDVPVVCFSMIQKNSDSLFGYVINDAALAMDEKSSCIAMFERLINDEQFRQNRIEKGRRFVADYIKQPVGKAGDEIIRWYKECVVNEAS